MSSFTLDLSKAVAAMKGDMDTVVGKVLIYLGTSLVLKSPVGNREKWAVNVYRASKGLPPTPAWYVGGRFRANWQYGFSKRPEGDLQDIDASGNASLRRIESGVNGSPKAGIHYLVNNLPYSESLENGKSNQAPNGMLQLTVIEFGGIVNRAVK